MTEVGPDKVSMVDTGNFYGLPSSSILTPLVKLYLNTKEKNTSTMPSTLSKTGIR